MQNVINFEKQSIIDNLPNDLITVSKFAAKYGVSKSHIYDFINKGLIKLYPFGYFKISENQTIQVLHRRKKKWQE